MTKTPHSIADRRTSIGRGLDFIYRVVCSPDGFELYGSSSICCFALVAATARDPTLRHVARSRAHALARRWRRVHPGVSPDPRPDLVLEFVAVRYALSRIGVRDDALEAHLRRAAAGLSAQELLGFDPVREPPPNDLPYPCDCGLRNQRGRRFCARCRKRLRFQSGHGVWMRALADAFVGARRGIVVGARYEDVLAWLPAMRPYPVDVADDVECLRDAVYAVTHVVYTLNDYGTYRLSPRWLPQEFAFLKANVSSACERHDPEVLGEVLDSLKAFGLRATHPLMTRGISYLLAAQNEDGSWGDPEEDNMRTRCHTTWTAIDGLRAYAWRGQRLSRPGVAPMLRRWVR